MFRLKDCLVARSWGNTPRIINSLNNPLIRAKAVMSLSTLLSRAAVPVIEAVANFYEVEGKAHILSAIAITVASRKTLQLTVRTHRKNSCTVCGGARTTDECSFVRELAVKVRNTASQSSSP